LEGKSGASSRGNSSSNSAEISRETFRFSAPGRSTTMQREGRCFRPPPGLECFGPGFPSNSTTVTCGDLKDTEASDGCTTSTVSTAPSSPASSYHPGQVLQSMATVPKVPIQLQLHEMVPEDSSAMPWPSLGSATHALGICKPCDFQHRTSCRAGYKCQFCHLCPPGENRRRKKQKQAAAKLCRRLEAAGEEAPTVTELIATLRLSEKI